MASSLVLRGVIGISLASFNQSAGGGDFLGGNLHEKAVGRHRVAVHAEAGEFVRHDRVEAGSFEPRADHLGVARFEGLIDSNKFHAPTMPDGGKRPLIRHWRVLASPRRYRSKAR